MSCTWWHLILCWVPDSRLLPKALGKALLDFEQLPKNTPTSHVSYIPVVLAEAYSCWSFPGRFCIGVWSLHGQERIRNYIPYHSLLLLVIVGYVLFLLLILVAGLSLASHTQHSTPKLAPAAGIVQRLQPTLGWHICSRGTHGSCSAMTCRSFCGDGITVLSAFLHFNLKKILTASAHLLKFSQFSAKLPKSILEIHEMREDQCRTCPAHHWSGGQVLEVLSSISEPNPELEIQDSEPPLAKLIGSSCWITSLNDYPINANDLVHDIQVY